MKLYHGTSAAALPAILEKGIVPRGSRVGNFSHSVESCPEAVYLTDTYPLYFAALAAAEADSFEGAIVEIETDLMRDYLFNADEDALEQAGRGGRDGLPKKWTLKRRTKHYRDQLLTTRWDWRASLKAMGTCAYMSTIRPSAITRVIVIDFQQHPRLHLAAIDASISLLNYKFCSTEHRLMTKWVFGDDPEPDEKSVWGDFLGEPAYMKEGRAGIKFVLGEGVQNGGTDGVSRIVSR